MVALFLEKAAEYGIEIFTDRTIASCTPAGGAKTRCHSIVTNHGEEVLFGECIFTTHPGDILRTISPLLKNEAFAERVEEFEESCGFFTLWAEVLPGPDGAPAVPEPASLISYLNKTKLPTLMSPSEPDNTATGIMTVREHTLDGRECETLTVFENVFPEEVSIWKETGRGNRGHSYEKYKEERCNALLEKCYRVRPELKGRLQILASASQLTYRDYLSPYGSAYGIRQKAGQFNIFGRLPVRNFYAAGQNALLPGAFGAMQSSFILWRKIAGEEAYKNMLENFYTETGGL